MSNVDSSAGASDVLVSFRGVQKSYDGEALIVKDLNLDIRKGEFLTLLGPSGSGKTTSLMMLAGFETPTAGEILLAGRSINNVPPHKRDIGMVFQNYALFPHMTVAENLAFPLSVRGMSKTDVAEKVKRALDMVQLGTFAHRYPAQLSGGQQQRVALARALVFEPQLVLMDEPLGALDKQLREHMQMEIKHLHQRLGVTVVYVTHDQGEALTMSDRVAVFHQGEIQQIAPPRTLYEEPKNTFVANFIGENNRLTGRLQNSDAQVQFAPEDRYYIAPSFTYKPDGSTKFTVLSSFQHDNTAVTSNFLPYYGTVKPTVLGLRIPRALNVGDANFNTFQRDQAFIGYEFEHVFDDTWAVRQNARYAFAESYQNSYIGQLGYSEDSGYPQFDLEKAKQLVQEYEAETGKPLEFTLLAVSEVQYAQQDQLLKKMWEAAGMKVTLDSKAGEG